MTGELPESIFPKSLGAKADLGLVGIEVQKVSHKFFPCGPKKLDIIPLSNADDFSENELRGKKSRVEILRQTKELFLCDWNLHD